MKSKWTIFEHKYTSILEVAASTCGLKISGFLWQQCKNPLVGTMVKEAFHSRRNNFGLG